jgi:hypothetical protein
MRHSTHYKTMKTTWGGLLLCLCLTLSLLAVTAGSAEAAPKRIATAKAGDCAACHGAEKVLPADHKDTKAMTGADCLGCHEKTGPSSLRTKMPASHTHQFAGVNCAKCHGKTKKPEEVKMKQCVACHNTDKLAEKTAGVKPKNPHESPHYGKTLDCNLCHHQHGKSENYCNQCHRFDFVVP